MSARYVIWDIMFWLLIVGVFLRTFQIIGNFDQKAQSASELLGARIVILLLGFFYIYWYWTEIPWATL